MKNIIIEYSSIAYFETKSEARAFAESRYGKRGGFALRKHYDLGGIWDVVPPAPNGVNSMRWMVEAEGARR